MNRDFFLLKKKMFLLILEKRDAAFPSLWTVFVLEQFGDVNFVTVLRDAGGSGERRSGCWELGGGGTWNLCQRQQEVRKGGGKRDGCHLELGNRNPEKGSGRVLRSGDVCGQGSG